MKNGKGKIIVTHINIRQSISLLLFKIFFLDFLAALFIASFLLLFVSTNIAVFTLTVPTLVVFGILVFIKLTLTMYVVMAWLNEYYELTENFVVHRRGIFFRKEDKSTLDRTRSISLFQGIFGKVFNYGTLTLYDIRFHKNIELYNIHNPIRYMHILETLIPGADEEKATAREHIIEHEQDEEVSHILNGQLT